MKYSVATYFDTELEKYFPPFVGPVNVDEFREAIEDAAKKKQITDCEHKKLYIIGVFDTEKGKLDVFDKELLIVDLTIYGGDKA